MVAEKAGVAPRMPFMTQVRQLLPIVLPGVRSKEAALLAVHSAFLVSRTFLSIYVAVLDGAIVKSLVDRNGRAFVISILKWLAIGITPPHHTHTHTPMILYES